MRYRHGDVILRRVDSIPEKAQTKEGLTLALGEVTGHSHRITEGQAALFGFNEKTYLRVQSEIACLTHEEHKALKLPAGDYEILIQEEYAPEGWKKVQD